MTIAYQSDLVVVHHADSRDVLPTLPTESVDLVATDPPYGKRFRSNRRVERFDTLFGDSSDDRTMIQEIMAGTVRIVGQHRHLYSFGPADVFDGLKVAELAELIWDKGRHGSGDVTAPWGPAHETIQFTVSKHRHAGETGKATLPARIRKGSVLQFNAIGGANLRHPSQKPLGLMRELIESSSRQGELVLDPFGGVGSTAVAAILCGRRAILIEENAGYVEIAVARIQEAERLALAAALC